MANTLQGVPTVIEKSTMDSTGTTRQTTRVQHSDYRPRLLIQLVVGVADVVLLLNFVFGLAGANPVGFVQFIKGIAGALAAPFSGIFANTAGAAHYTNWADIVAVVVWSVCAFIVIKLIAAFSQHKMSQNTTSTTA